MITLRDKIESDSGRRLRFASFGKVVVEPGEICGLLVKFPNGDIRFAKHRQAAEKLIASRVERERKRLRTDFLASEIEWRGTYV
jgi:hypothetical protein